jgi:hypothetical protein
MGTFAPVLFTTIIHILKALFTHSAAIKFYYDFFNFHNSNLLFAPGSAHARPSAQPAIDTSGNFVGAHVFK